MQKGFAQRNVFREIRRAFVKFVRVKERHVVNAMSALSFRSLIYPVFTPTRSKGSNRLLLDSILLRALRIQSPSFGFQTAYARLEDPRLQKQKTELFLILSRLMK